MLCSCYLIEMSDGQHILINSGFPPDVLPPPQAPRPQNEKNVLQHLSELALNPEEISTVVCTHCDVDHGGYHDSVQHAEFVVRGRHFDLARGGHPRYAARSHWDHPALKYCLIDSDFELAPGPRLVETSGLPPDINLYWCTCREPARCYWRSMPWSCNDGKPWKMLTKAPRYCD